MSDARRILAAMALGLGLAPQPGAAQERIVWHGVEVTESSGLDVREGGPPPQDHSWRSRVEVRFRYVEEVMPDGSREFSERRLDWSLSFHKEIHSVRGGRELMVSTDCDDGGVVELGPSQAADWIPPEQEKELRPECDVWRWEDQAPGRSQWGYWEPTPPSVRAPDLVRTDCHREQEAGRSYEVWQGRTEATIDVPDEHASFLPEPGRRLSFTASSQTPVRFRFTLDDVSSFAGFATNASIDARFFRSFPRIAHLSSRYRDGDPDLIFDPEAHPPALWTAAGWTGLFTEHEGVSATVDVTALDYGAWGRLRAYAKSGCGGWEPVPFRQAGAEREALTIPLDDDANLMADALLPIYRGDPGSDLDETPDGDGTAGDGLTLFEEYRGFRTLDGMCNPGGAERYLRTGPLRKDLFVHSPDAVLARLALRLAAATDLAVHCIGPGHFVSPEQRVVNFTLQQSGRRRFRGATVSQAEPQHGLFLVSTNLGSEGLLGRTDPPAHGPPRHVARVLVNKAAAKRIGPRVLEHVVLHELGHAVGIRHHGDDNVEGPVVLLEHGDCAGKLETAGLASGRPGCRTSFVAERGAQNSGQAICPMKYFDWRWYAHPDHPLVPFGYVEFAWRHDGMESRERLPALMGRFVRYDKQADEPGTGRFCSDRKGTGINAESRRAGNHAGDSTRTCAQQIRVNDLDTWGDDGSE